MIGQSLSSNALRMIVDISSSVNGIENTRFFFRIRDGCVWTPDGRWIFGWNESVACWSINTSSARWRNGGTLDWCSRRTWSLRSQLSYQSCSDILIQTWSILEWTYPHLHWSLINRSTMSHYAWLGCWIACTICYAYRYSPPYFFLFEQGARGAPTNNITHKKTSQLPSARSRRT